MDSMNDQAWRKSTYSGGNGGGCVEAADAPGMVLVRDTTNRGGGTLELSVAAWRAFTAGLKKA
jgi:Domain of unknown function (DUF397)